MYFLVAGTVAFVLFATSPFLISLCSINETQSKLKISPQGLRSWHISFVFVLLIVKSAAQFLKVGRRFRFEDQSLNGNTQGDSPQTFTVAGPLFQLEMPLGLSKSVLAKYEKAVGISIEHVDFADQRQLALLLSAVSEPAILLLLAKMACPVRPLGAVNVRNRFDLLHPSACIALLSCKHEAVITANLRPLVKKVRRGFELDLDCEIASEDLGGPIFRQTFTMLQFEKHRQPIEASQPSKTLEAPSELHQAQSIRVESKDPWLWADVCKDYNPIHLYDLTAKMFGFPRKIAHGNHVVAKALALLGHSNNNSEGSTEKKGERLDHPNNTATWVEVEFRRPMPVPTTADVLPMQHCKDFGASKSFSILHKQKLCVEVHSGSTADSSVKK